MSNGLEDNLQEYEDTQRILRLEHRRQHVVLRRTLKITLGLVFWMLLGVFPTPTIWWQSLFQYTDFALALGATVYGIVWSIAWLVQHGKEQR